MKILREQECAQVVGVSAVTLRNIRRDPELKFPKPRKIYGGLFGWLSTDVESWLSSRPVAEDR